MSDAGAQTKTVPVVILGATLIASVLSWTAPAAAVATVACLIVAVYMLHRTPQRSGRGMLWCAVAIALASVGALTVATLAVGTART